MTPVADSLTALSKREDQDDPSERAKEVHEELRSLSQSQTSGLERFLRLADEVIEQQYYREFGYKTAIEYFKIEINYQTRTVYRLIAAHRALQAVPRGDRPEARRGFAKIGATKAAIIAPLVERDGQNWRALVEMADRKGSRELRKRVSEMTDAKPRGRAKHTWEKHKCPRRCKRHKLTGAAAEHFNSLMSVIKKARSYYRSQPTVLTGKRAKLHHLQMGRSPTPRQRAGNGLPIDVDL